MLSQYASDPEAGYAEEIRKVGAFVIHHRQNQGRKSWLVTSYWPGEGKTSVCLSLAACLGEFGYRVLWVDADTKAEGLMLLLGRENRDRAPTFEAVPTSMRGVDLISARTGESEDFSQALTNPAFWRAIEAAAPDYDLILTDAPALSTHKEAVFACLWAQSCLIVADPQRFQGPLEGHRVEDLRDRGFEVLGCIISPTPRA